MENDTTPNYSGPELCALQAHEVVALLRKGEVSVDELVDASMQRHRETDPVINAMPITCFERAKEASRHLPATATEGRGALHGLPVGIKDLTAVSGVRSTWGTPALADFVPDKSDPLVEKIEERGGLVVGKTNTPEFGAGGNTFNAIFGPTRNPWNTRLTSSGSSGGTAAQLITGQTWLSQGSDHGGSLRTPAAYCGVVGLRPSPGIVAGGPAEAGFITEGVQGPMARSVADCALFLDTMSGFDPRYPLSYPPAPDSYFESIKSATPQGLRIAYTADMDGQCPVEPEMRNHIEAALAAMERAGSQVAAAELHLDGLKRAYLVQRGILWATMMRDIDPAVRKGFKQTLEGNVQEGLALTINDIVDSQKMRSRIYDEMENLFKNFDVLASPVVGCMPFPIEMEWVQSINGEHLSHYMDWLGFAFLATAAGLPAISVPVGFTPEGLPVGLQLVGPPRGETKLLQAARAVEMVFGGPLAVIDPKEG